MLRQRFALERCLGRGAMGIVYVALDRTSNRRVALKTLLAQGPDEVYQLKKEFRSLTGIAAPNLVHLHEMHAEDDGCFFTMELIHGVPFSEAFLPAAPSAARVDFSRLRDGIVQLVHGLATLHEHGKLHRDIKPTNVLVEDSGRVVLVDFGLTHSIQSLMSRQSQAGQAAGTFAYMAPEQAWGRPLTPAADFYSLGAMLYEMLTGKLPPSPLEGYERASGAGCAALHPKAIESATPDDLDRLVMGLLDKAPAARPGPTQIAAILERAPPVSLVSDWELAPGARPIVGRQQELEQLDQAFQAGKGRFASACVAGPSGIGKTALLQHFVATLEANSRATVLRATCHPRESLPFKAVDGIIDDLVRVLKRDRPERLSALVPPESDLLARLFPVFGRVCEPANSVAGDPHETRRRAFAALAELLRRMTRRQRVVMWIDDLQWGDLDSVALLAALLHPQECPHVFFILSHRDGPGEIVDAIRALTQQAGTPDATLQLWLSALSFDESCDLAKRLLGSARTSESLEIAREARGDPLLVTELARFLAGRPANAATIQELGLAGIVRARVDDLPQASQRILRLAALAGQPLLESLLLSIDSLDVTAEIALGQLIDARLLAACVHDDQAALDVSHGRIRERIVEDLSPEERRFLHRDLAQLLELRTSGEPERFVEHYMLAGEPAIAAARAIVAAERASRAMAFDQASRLYQVALELGSSNLDVWDLEARLGAALVSAGKGGSGAARLESAARTLERCAPHDSRVLQLRRRAAEQYLRSGLHTEGLNLLRQVIGQVELRYPSSGANALASMLVLRARLGNQLRLVEAVRVRELSPLERERLEVCWSAGLGLAVFDLMRAAYFQVRHATLARDSGELSHISRSIATAGLLSVWEGGTSSVRKGRSLLQSGQLLAERTGDPNIRAYAALMKAVAAYYEARYDITLEMCESGERFCHEECSTGSWELANFQVLMEYALASLGEFARLRAVLLRVLREARERDDRYCLVTARLGSCNMGWIAAGESRVARGEVEDALAGPFPSSYTWQIHQGSFALTQVDLYEGKALQAWQRCTHAWGELKSRQMLRFMATRVEMLCLRVRCALRVAAEDADRRPEMLRFADKAIKMLRKEDAPWVDPFADGLEAGARVIRREQRVATSLLERAALGFDGYKLAAHAASARFQAAVIDGDTERTRSSGSTIAGLGVAEPAVFANLLVPAFRSTAND